MVSSNPQLQKLREFRLKRIAARRERVRQMRERAKSAANKKREANIAARTSSNAQTKAVPKAVPKAKPKAVSQSNQSVLAAAKRSLNTRAVRRPVAKRSGGGCNCGAVGHY